MQACIIIKKAVGSPPYRGYNPLALTARWLSRDPIEENGGLNLYEYVGGNRLPIRYFNGENPLLVIGIGAAVGGLVSGITTYARLAI